MSFTDFIVDDDLDSDDFLDEGVDEFTWAYDMTPTTTDMGPEEWAVEHELEEASYKYGDWAGRF